MKLSIVALGVALTLLGLLVSGSGLYLAGSGSAAAGDFSPGKPNGREDPCRKAKTRAKLLCPDLKIGRPSEMYLDRTTRPGYALLRATNDIRSRGAGPMELRGHRDRPRSMNVTQAITRRSGGYAFYPTQARLRFFQVGYQWGGAYWKVRDPLRFELWRIDSKRRKTRLVKIGPKQFYCFRDLERTNPSARSPASAVFPACNQNPLIRTVRLGTSPGWSDIYPSTYQQQWINVTGLRGCFAYVLHLDPGNVLFELKKHNNQSQRIIRLPWRGYQHPGC